MTPQNKAGGSASPAGSSAPPRRSAGAISDLVSKRRLDAATIVELEELLIRADLGVNVAARIGGRHRRGPLRQAGERSGSKAILAAEVEKVLSPVAKPLVIDAGIKPFVILIVGVNGSGKTTTIGKLAARFRAEGRKVMLAAGDTFRAAAIEQLKIWGRRTGFTNHRARAGFGCGEPCVRGAHGGRRPKAPTC